MMEIYAFCSRPEGPVKIGISRDPEKRRHYVARPEKHARLKCFYRQPLTTAAARRAEQLAHTILADNRIGGEWFSVSAETARSAILDAISRLPEYLHPINPHHDFNRAAPLCPFSALASRRRADSEAKIVRKYIPDSDLFLDNAAARVGL